MRMYLSILSLALLATIVAGPALVNAGMPSNYGGLSNAFSIVGDTLKLRYDFIFNISISNLGGTPVSLTVIEHYLYVIIRLNSTHVRVMTSPVGNITLRLESGSWVSVASMLKLLGSNVSALLTRFIIPSIKETVIPVSKLPQVLKAVTGVSPVRLKVVPVGCTNISVDGVVFNVRRYPVGVSGVAYYECRTGVLLKYVNSSSTILGREGARVKIAFEVTLSAANPTLIKATAVGVAGRKARTGATQAGLGGQRELLVAYAILAASAGIAAVAGYMFARVRRSVRR